MLQFLVRRLFLLIPTLVFISIVAFLVIELPPGDYLTSYAATLRQSGDVLQQEQLQALKKQYGLDRPLVGRYFFWIGKFIRGDMGMSFDWNKPVKDLLWERLALTFVLSLSSLLFTEVLGFLVGLYSAIHQYSLLDYLFTTVSFVGLGIPDFLIALVILWFAFSRFGLTLSGLFSQQYQSAPWSLAKVANMLSHLWLPMIILSVGGTAGMIRTMRANMLDELRKPYVTTARAKGLTENRLLLKYPVRVALNPFISTIGWMLPALVSGSTIISVVLSLPTTGPLLLRSLMNQDMYLAASFLMMLSVLTVIGTLLSDLLLAWLDPRIRIGGE